MLLNTHKIEIDGILLMDKPAGYTSHDIVQRVRKKLKIKRVGHAGTLDPLATGLLIILIGKATKASQYLISLGKAYHATMLLGQTTDSQDADGQLLLSRPVPNFSIQEIENTLQTFAGDQYQIPPMFSAKKIDGTPLYKLARKGQEVERQPHFIHISKIELLNLKLPQIEFFVKCSKGTYVRTLAHDIGEKLGCGAHLIQLRRTHTDSFNIENALTLEAFEAMDIPNIRNALIPIYKAVPKLAALNP